MRKADESCPLIAAVKWVVAHVFKIRYGAGCGRRFARWTSSRARRCSLNLPGSVFPCRHRAVRKFERPRRHVGIRYVEICLHVFRRRSIQEIDTSVQNDVMGQW